MRKLEMTELRAVEAGLFLFTASLSELYQDGPACIFINGSTLYVNLIKLFRINKLGSRIEASAINFLNSNRITDEFGIFEFVFKKTT